jgi:hypothetical protein
MQELHITNYKAKRHKYSFKLHVLVYGNVTYYFFEKHYFIEFYVKNAD